jgi:hypothetical protein
LAAVQLAESSEFLYNSFIREQAPEVVAYLNLADQVKHYCKEIEEVESTYASLLEARAEAERYSAKIDAIQRAKTIDGVKKLRNLSKMDKQKDTYKELLTKVIASQKHTYAKHPAVFRAAMVGYWQSHERHVTLLTQSLRHTQEFAARHADEMRDFDVAALNIELETLKIGISTSPTSAISAVSLVLDSEEVTAPAAKVTVAPLPAA